MCGSCGRRITATEFPNPTTISTEAEVQTEKMDYNFSTSTEYSQLEATTPFPMTQNNESPSVQDSSKETILGSRNLEEPNDSTTNPPTNGKNNDTDVKIDCYYYFGEQCRFYDAHQIMLSAPLLKVLARRSS